MQRSIFSPGEKRAMMKLSKLLPRERVLILCWLGAAVGLAAFSARAHAAGYQDLAVVKPVVSCDQIARNDLAQAVGSAVTIKAAEERDTPKGQYCKVTGTIAPAV